MNNNVFFVIAMGLGCLSFNCHQSYFDEVSDAIDQYNSDMASCQTRLSPSLCFAEAEASAGVQFGEAWDDLVSCTS